MHEPICRRLALYIYATCWLVVMLHDNVMATNPDIDLENSDADAVICILYCDYNTHAWALRSMRCDVMTHSAGGTAGSVLWSNTHSTRNDVWRL